MAKLDMACGIHIRCRAISDSVIATYGRTRTPQWEATLAAYLVLVDKGPSLQLHYNGSNQTAGGCQAWSFCVMPLFLTPGFDQSAIGTVAFFVKFFQRNETQRGRINAVAEPSAFHRTVIEDVSKMAVTVI